MKTRARLLSYVLVAVMLLSIMAVPNVGPLGVDVVSAATGGSSTPTTPVKPTPTTPTTPTTPVKPTPVPTPTTPTAPTKVTTPAAPASAVTPAITRVLKYGMKGNDVKLLQTWLNNYGYKLKADGAFGKGTLTAVKDYQKKNGLKVDGIVTAQMVAKLDPAMAKVAIKMGRAEYAANGTKCFTVPVVLMLGDKILAASIDDYQFISSDVAKGVPNSDKDFGLNYKDPKMVLASKRTNTAYYSEHMKEEAKSTVAIDKNYDYIQAYVAGKTVGELKAILAKNTKEQMVDVVSGATLVDTYGYISSIVAAAEAAK